MSDKDLAEQLQQPINSDVEYFDATAAILKLTETVEQLNSRVEGLERVLMVQADINGKFMEFMNRQLLLNAQEQKPKSSIILPDRVN